MEQPSFGTRLQTCLRVGGLRISDIAVWFDRDYHTVRFWVQNDSTPKNEAAMEGMLCALEKAVTGDKRFPFPLSFHPVKRKEKLRQIRNEYAARLPESDPALGRT